MKIGLRVKFGIFFMVFGLVMLSAMCGLIYFFTQNVFMEHYKDSIGKIVDVTACSLELSPDEISSYAETENADDRYWDILDKMRQIREMSEFAYIYVLYPTDEDTAVWVFYVSEAGDVEELGAPILDYAEDKYDMVRDICLTGEQNDTLDYTNTDTGLVVSIYYPLNDENGDTVAVLGGDVYMDEINELFKESILKIAAQIAVLFAAGILLLLLFVQFGVVRSISRLKQGVQKMADGELGVQVFCKRRDEIGDITTVFNRMSRKISNHMDETQELNRAYRKFVPPDTFDILHKRSVVDISLGDQEEAELTVLCMEPVGFKEYVHNLSSEETFRYINGILEKTVPAVLEGGGTIEHFEKAGICSYYRSNAENALRSAVMACENLAAGGDGGRLCAGIAQGTVMVGIAGQEERMDIISVSEQTRLSEFLMEIAPKYNASILLSQKAAAQIKDLEQSYHYRFLGYLKIAAAERPEGIYDVFDGDAAKDRRYKQITKEAFEQGVRLFCEGNYEKARQSFIDVLKQYRRDEAAKIYLTLCSSYLQNGGSEPEMWIETL